VATTKGIQNQFFNSLNKTIAEVKQIVEKIADVFDRANQKLATADISPAGNVVEIGIRLIPASLKNNFSIPFFGSYPMFSPL